MVNFMVCIILPQSKGRKTGRKEGREEGRREEGGRKEKSAVQLLDSPLVLGGCDFVCYCVSGSVLSNSFNLHSTVRSYPLI